MATGPARTRSQAGERAGRVWALQGCHWGVSRGARGAGLRPEAEAGLAFGFGPRGGPDDGGKTHTQICEHSIYIYNILIEIRMHTKTPFTLDGHRP